MSEQNTQDLLHKAKVLRNEHEELEAEIDKLSKSPAPDQIRIQRLKKRKLTVKDYLKKIEAGLVPDIIA